jgi:hypothetical protein
MENRKIISALIVLAFVIVPILGILTVVPTAKALEVKSGDVNKTKEGKTEMDLTWDTSSVGKPLTMNLSLNKGWSIESATIGVSPLPYVTDAGTQWETINYPDRPRMDVGRNGDDWVWPGTFGHQAQYANESDSEEPAFSSKDTQYLYIPLPVGAKIQDIRFNVNNTASGQYEYRMTVGSGTKTVWYKSSIGFSKGPFIPTKDPTAANVQINSVCVDHLDFLFDTYKDIVAVGTGGQLFTMMHNKDEPTGYPAAPVPVQIGQMDTHNVVPDLLDCSLGDYNQDITNELAVSTGDGKMFVLGNDGMGNFQAPGYKVDSGLSSRMETVTFGDVNNDGWSDVVGGYLRGQFFISTYDNTKGTFKNPYEVKAGTGAMNDIQVVDMDLDGNNDLAGANNDRNWWTVKNTGKGAYPWQDAKPVRSSGSDLTALAVTDLNFDNSPDLVSGSQDGSFYVAYNIGGNTFDEPQALRGGLDSMKDITSGDLDLDGDVDVLGLNADGWIYSSKNEFGSLQDGMQLISVGKDQNAIALGDLNNDNALDIILGGTKGVSIYYNNLGPFAQTVGINDSGALKSEAQKYLDTFHGTDDDYDAFGNLIVDVPIKIFSSYPGTLKFDKVNVTYTYQAKVDVKTALSLYVKANQDRANTQGYVDVPIQFMTDSVGRIHISDIAIHYKENLQAIIDGPLPGSIYNMSTPVPLKGHANFDLFCKLDGFLYTWLVDGRIVGTGCEINAKPKEDLGGVGSHNLRLNVKYVPTGETTYANVLISLVPDLRPSLIVKVNLDTNAQYIEDKKITVSVTITNNGAVNASNIGILISDGSRRVASRTVPLVPVGSSKPTEVNMTWTPSAGAHTICTSVVPADTPGQLRSCAQIYVNKKPFDYTIFAIILIVIIVMALVGYFGIKYAQGAHDRRAKKEKQEMEAKLKAQMQADFADIYGPTGPPTVGSDPNAYGGQQAYAGYDSYGGGTSYGDTSPAYQTFKCPRCGQPTAELGVQCFACDAKDSVKYADEAIKEVKELGIDVDEAENLLNNAKNSLKAGNYEVALEESEEAEDIASEVKERYDKAFSMISAEGAETAAERRRKRLERRKAAREKKDRMDATGGEGGDAAPAPTEGGDGAPPAEKQ